MLGEGHYVRYDESTAERLLKLCEKLNKEYGGKISGIHEASENRKDFEKRLGEFEGIGPKTVEIFMREAGKVWLPQANPLSKGAFSSSTYRHPHGSSGYQHPPHLWDNRPRRYYRSAF